MVSFRARQVKIGLRLARVGREKGEHDAELLRLAQECDRLETELAHRMLPIEKAVGVFCIGVLCGMVVGALL